ncbi:hypothetical protein RYX36_021209, partial [Vicia faba]
IHDRVIRCKINGPINGTNPNPTTSNHSQIGLTFSPYPHLQIPRSRCRSRDLRPNLHRHQQTQLQYLAVLAFERYNIEKDVSETIKKEFDKRRRFFFYWFFRGYLIEEVNNNKPAIEIFNTDTSFFLRDYRKNKGFLILTSFEALSKRLRQLPLTNLSRNKETQLQYLAVLAFERYNIEKDVSETIQKEFDKRRRFFFYWFFRGYLIE